jgi:hypothetical protein
VQNAPTLPLARPLWGEYHEIVLIWPRSRVGLPRPRPFPAARRIPITDNRYA